MNAAVSANAAYSHQTLQGTAPALQMQGINPQLQQGWQKWESHPNEPQTYRPPKLGEKLTEREFRIAELAAHAAKSAVELDCASVNAERPGMRLLGQAARSAETVVDAYINAAKRLIAFRGEA